MKMAFYSRDVSLGDLNEQKIDEFLIPKISISKMKIAKGMEFEVAYRELHT